MVDFSNLSFNDADSISNLTLSVRAENTLHNAGVKTIGDLRKANLDKFKLTKLNKREIREVLAELDEFRRLKAVRMRAVKTLFLMHSIKEREETARAAGKYMCDKAAEHLVKCLDREIVAVCEHLVKKLMGIALTGRSE